MSFVDDGVFVGGGDEDLVFVGGGDEDLVFVGGGEVAATSSVVSGRFEVIIPVIWS